jgi:uncharacterized protein DUF4160
MMDAPADQFGEACVPTIHRLGPYRFFFYANENLSSGEPPHVHVVSPEGSASFWLSPVSVRGAWGYTPREIERIRRIITGSRAMLLRRWDEFFDHT